MKYLPTIGMEIHVHLKTKSKMFCGCENVSWKIGVKETKANSAICPVCTGQPGILPVLNLAAIKMIVKAGLALNCGIAKKSKFDRKNYFYPDLPKGYQISQYDEPICQNGYLEVGGLGDTHGQNTQYPIPNTKKISNIQYPISKANRIRIRRIHAEEDTGRTIHPAGEDYSLVDLNRAGVPLMELVTEPDIHSAQEAKEFCQELREIFRALDISDADMEKGQMRCEVNISIAPLPKLEPNKPNNDQILNSVETSRREDPKQVEEEYIQGAGNTGRKENGTSQKLGTKVEIKNLNSFKAVERSIEYEIKRQGRLLDEGSEVVHETRGWDERKQETVGQRTKEQAHDYRYFLEPDLPPLRFGRQNANKDTRIQASKHTNKSQITNHKTHFFIDVDEIAASLSELPRDKQKRFMEQYGFKAEDARILVGNSHLADYTENVISELKNWLVNIDQEGSMEEVWQKNKAKLGKLTAGWLINKLGGLLTVKEIGVKDIKITPENFAELITLIYENKVNSSSALSLLEKMLEAGGDPSSILEDEGMGLIDNVAELEPLVHQVVQDNPDQVKAYQKGKEALLKFFVGQVMKLSKGKANPKMAEELLLERLAY